MKPTPEQEAVIRHCRGPLLVLAPVGTGKTTVLARRLLAAISDGIPASNCLCITFTNRAARELAERFEHLRDPALRERPLVSTFHSFCARLLREEAAAAGLRGDFSIYDEDDSAELLARLLPREEGRREDESLGQARRVLQLWSRALSALERGELKARGLPGSLLARFDEAEATALRRWLEALKEHNSLDFSLLVYKARALLQHDAEVRKRWRARWQWIQVDEVQDTHLSEWEVLEHLAGDHGNLALFGDLDQTIYGWRGSRPRELLQAFSARWPKAGRLALSVNHRGTKRLLELADRAARGMSARDTKLQPSRALPQGEEVRLLQGRDLKEEAELVASALLERFSSEPEARESTAILLRAQYLAPAFRQALEAAGLPCSTESDLRFFRQREVRDALAPLQLLVNPGDRSRLARWLRWSGRLTPSLKAAMAVLLGEGPSCQLRVTDLFDLAALEHKDPFAPLLRAWKDNLVAVLDLETTGLEPWDAEIVEIALQVVARDFPADEYERLLQIEGGLGGSEAVHGIDRETLRKQGVPPAEALRELAGRVGGLPIVGHNVGFDVEFLLYHYRRQGLSSAPVPYYDTLEMARRLLPAAGGYSLGALKERLDLPVTPTHRAMDDVACTVELLRVLLPKLEEYREEREDLLAQHAAAARPAAERLARWRELAWTLPPAELLDHILREESEHPGARPPDEALRRKLVDWMKRQQRDLPPWYALREVLGRSSLNRNAELAAEGRIPILTVHASKGMEFDHVVLGGASEGILPDRRNAEGEGLEEERRVFYVAVTRPKKSLTLSSSRLDFRGEAAGWSRFVCEAFPEQAGGEG